MKFPRIPATFGVLVVVAGSFTASPTQARANDVALAFGVRTVTPITFTATAPAFTAAQWAAEPSAGTLMPLIRVPIAASILRLVYPVDYRD